jgi:Flp pilus assembly pilin Flp
MLQAFLRFCRDTKGATVLEYAWIATLISISIVAILHTINQRMQNWYWAAINNLAS